MSDPNPCQATGCAMTGEPITVCVDHCCPHRWTREAREDRSRREEADRRNGMMHAKEDGKCL